MSVPIVQPEYCEFVLERVAVHFGITPAEAHSRSRLPHVCRARWITGAILVANGLTVGDGSRFFDQNHSTMCSGLGRVEAEPALAALLADLRIVLAPSSVSVETGIAHALSGLSPALAARVTAYLTTCVRGLPGRPPSGPAAYHALSLLRANPAIADQIAASLAAHDEHAAAVLLRARVARLAASFTRERNRQR